MTSKITCCIPVMNTVKAFITDFGLDGKNIELTHMIQIFRAAVMLHSIGLVFTVITTCSSREYGVENRHTFECSAKSCRCQWQQKKTLQNSENGQTKNLVDVDGRNCIQHLWYSDCYCFTRTGRIEENTKVHI